MTSFIVNFKNRKKSPNIITETELVFHREILLQIQRVFSEYFNTFVFNKKNDILADKRLTAHSAVS